MEAKTTLKKGNEDSTVSLSFYDESGEYKDTLAAENKVMIVSLYKPKTTERKWREVSDFVCNSEKAGFKSLVLVSATPEQMTDHLSSMPQTAELLKDRLYYSDYKTLISLNRSNGGVTYFSDGYLIRKWAERARPTPKELIELATGDDTEVIIGTNTNRSITFQAFILYALAVLLLL